MSKLEAIFEKYKQTLDSVKTDNDRVAELWASSVWGWVRDNRNSLNCERGSGMIASAIASGIEDAQQTMAESKAKLEELFRQGREELKRERAERIERERAFDTEMRTAKAKLKERLAQDLWREQEELTSLRNAIRRARHTEKVYAAWSEKEKAIRSRFREEFTIAKAVVRKRRDEATAKELAELEARKEAAKPVELTKRQQRSLKQKKAYAEKRIRQIREAKEIERNLRESDRLARLVPVSHPAIIGATT
jgi:hypothetical protein